MSESLSSSQMSIKMIKPVLPHKEATCYGPVSDISQMVPDQWWKTVFSDSLYLKTDGDAVEDADITREEIGLLESKPEVKSMLLKGSIYGDTKPGKVLDLCCGQGRHSLHLLKEYPHLLIHGHDQSSYLISLAVERAAFQDSQVPPKFTVGDCRKIPYPNDTFDLILLLGNSFGYFSEDEQDCAVLAEVYRVLAPDGILIMDLTDGDFMRHNFAERSWEWADETTLVCRERKLSKDGLRLFSREIISSTNKGVIRDQFYQERLYSRSELCKLLVSSGFTPKAPTSVETNVSLAADMSKRGEDLGMMANRMWVSASKGKSSDFTDPLEKLVNIQLDHKEFSPTPLDEIVVLLGDPSKKCIGKLNDSWNAEDIITREKLVKALLQSGISGDSVRFIDSHDDAIVKLLKQKPQFVLNLCDEGWNNDALKELHIPALLEMLDIPYSGAGPNCLAFCYDKGLVNRSAEALGIPVPKELTFVWDKTVSFDVQINRLGSDVKNKIKFPAFVKPMKGDNSLGITGRSIVQSTQDLEAYMNELAAKGLNDVLIQEYLVGTEYGVGMIGNLEDGFTFLPTLEVDFSKIVSLNLPPILGYESKWDPSSPYWTEIGYKKAKLSPVIEQKLQQSCIRLWERFGCRDYARFDFRCDLGRGDGFDGLHGTIKLLEVNPNPGWCWDGKLAYMAKLAGYEYSDLLCLIIKAANDRINRK